MHMNMSLEFKQLAQKILFSTKSPYGTVYLNFPSIKTSFCILHETKWIVAKENETVKKSCFRGNKGDGILEKWYLEWKQ